MSEDINVTEGTVLEALNNKVDTDAGNLTANGKSLISGLSMPSNKYIDLTLGASGTTYTAPANGYYTLNKISGTSNKYIGLTNNSNKNGESAFSSGSDNWLHVSLPVKKGDIVQVSYNATGTTNYFRFIYAEGEV